MKKAVVAEDVVVEAEEVVVVEAEGTVPEAEAVLLVEVAAHTADRDPEAGVLIAQEEAVGRAAGVTLKAAVRGVVFVILI